MNPEEHQCQGGCGEHRGDVRQVRVSRGSTSWGAYWYCEKAIQTDEENGFLVEPLSNPEPERTSDAPCAPTTTDTPTPSSLSASNATGSERSIRTESVAMVGGAPRTDEAELEAHIGVTSFGHEDVLKAFAFARALETDLLAARAEVDQLKTQLTSVIPNSAPASPAWLAKAAQREDALTIAELRKDVDRLTKGHAEVWAGREELRGEVARLTKERNELKRRLGEGPARIQELERERDSLGQQLAEAQATNKKLGDSLEQISTRFAITGTAPKIAEQVCTQLSAATARAEEWENKLKEIYQETLRPTSISHDYDLTPSAEERLRNVRALSTMPSPPSTP